MRLRPKGLWLQQRFVKFLLALTVSQLGSEITLLALPLAAVALLDASTSQMGILTAMATLPYLIVGLPAGIWVDRLRRQPLLISADLARILVLMTVPLAVAFDSLSMPHLYIVAFIHGTFTLIFSVAQEAYLPSVLDKDDLVEGYSEITASTSLTQIIGPGIGGLLIQLFTAPFAIILDIITFLASAILVRSIKTPEAHTIQQAPISALTDLRLGINFVVANRLVRPLLATSAWVQLFTGAIEALMILYLSEKLNFTAAMIGAAFMIGSLGGLLISIISKSLIERFGLGPTAIAATFMMGINWLIIVLFTGQDLMAAFAVVAFARMTGGAGLMLYNICFGTLIQSLTPPHLLGRVNASFLFLSWGTLPIGALLGGSIASSLGLSQTMLYAAIGLSLAVVWIIFSPLRNFYAVTESDGPFIEGFVIE